jgi:uncharacterized LabA/DUF88 family protein
MFYRDDRLAVMIDGPNFHHAARALGIELDYRKVREEFQRRGRLMALCYYTVMPETEAFSPLRPLVDWLGYNGYRTVTRVREASDHAASRRGRSAIDMEMAVDALDLASHIDHLVLASGDGVFTPLVRALQRRGLRVTVIATLRSEQPMLADDLRRAADAFVDFEDLRSAIARAPREAE